MSTLEDRIKLAEAMGWQSDNALPDPLTDANDDYAVLKWVEDKWALNRWRMFKGALEGLRHYRRIFSEYVIGDYARAALIVMASEEQEHE